MRPEITLVRSMGEYQKFVRWFRSGPDAIAFDLETTGVDPLTDRIRLLQVSDDQTAWCFPFDWIGPVKEQLETWTGPTIAHNSAFDYAFLKEYGFENFPDPGQMHDTMFMLKALDPSQRAGLKEASEFYVTDQARDGQAELKAKMRKHGWDWATIPIDCPEYWVYGGLDCILTYLLARTLTEHMDEDPRYWETYQLEMSLVPIFVAMRKVGVKVDTEAAQKLDESLEHEAALRYESFQETYGFAPSKTQALGTYLQSEGVEFTEFTATGQPRLTAAILETIKHPAAQAVCDYRDVAKMRSAYTKNILASAQRDGRIHAEFRQAEARTGRSSVSKPALQQIPRVKGTELRSLFIADKGHKLVSVDYSQQELRILAALSEDDKLNEIFSSTDDPFVAIGNHIFDTPMTGKEDPRRDMVKALSYGLAYGIGDRKFAAQVGITPGEAGDIRQSLYHAFPGLERFMKDTVRQGRNMRQPAAWSMYGRRVTADPGYEYKLTNYRIQSTAADQLKRALLLLARNGYEDYLRLVVHDEIILELPDAMALDKVLIREIEELMEEAAPSEMFGGLAFPAQAVVGETYAALK